MRELLLLRVRVRLPTPRGQGLARAPPAKPAPHAASELLRPRACLPCSIPVSECTAWAQHCMASHTCATWRAKREEHARKAAPSAAGGGASSAGHYVPRPIVTRWSCDELLSKVQQP